jgi:hypothetical protein
MNKEPYYTIEIHEDSLERTADVLDIINPGRSSEDHMRAMVRANMWDGTTSMGTAGWEATGYFPKDRPGVMVVRFSVMAYSVEQYIDKIEQERLRESNKFFAARSVPGMWRTIKGE